MYKPNFCAECGERIFRPRWHPWTSGRFCPSCAPRFRAGRVLWTALAGAALFSLGLGAGRALLRPAPPPLIVERRTTPPTPTALPQPSSANAKTESLATVRPAPSAGNTATERVNDSSEIVSTCGALTKKGTPCQRRVRGTGRCWQHLGQPAVIPLEQRLITGR
jgi:hypothetical protein